MQPALPASGSYTALIDAQNYTTSRNAPTGTLELVVSDEHDAGTLTADGAAVAVATSVVGQASVAQFTASAGENLGLGVDNFAQDPDVAGGATIYVLKPDGSTLTSFSCNRLSNGCAANLRNLPAGGIYRVSFEPSLYAASGSARLWLSHDVQQTLALGQSSVVSLGRPGQDARIVFSGTAGQRIRLAASSPTILPVYGVVAVSLLKPDGSCLIASCWQAVSTGTSALFTETLPADGSYVIALDAFNDPLRPNAVTGDVTLDLSLQP